RFDTTLQTFVPERSVQRERSVGAAAGILEPQRFIAGADEAGWAAAESCGRVSYRRMREPEAPPPSPPPPSWAARVTGLGRRGGDARSWVDFLSDVTCADLKLAVRENYRSVEHIKRYTTTGMAPDQGKTSNVNAIGIVGTVMERAPAQVGTTR